MSSGPPAGSSAAGDRFDVVVIGAGIVGAAIARDLAGTTLDGVPLAVALVEARPDVGDLTSKANTAILHTGFDATPGTLESRLVARGYHLLTEYAAAAGIPVERPGAILVAWTDEELAALPDLKRKAEANGYQACVVITAEQVYEQLPDLGPGALGGLTVPGEAITCTWTTNLALATEAVLRGAVLLRSHEVVGVAVQESVTELRLGTGATVRARWVVNAAGLGADHLDRLFGHDRFTVTPRRGELLVFDKQARPMAPKIVLPVPSSLGKGVLISPTIYGNVMLGPTAEDLDDPTDTSTTQVGYDYLLGKGGALMPALLHEEVTATYAGLRAAIDAKDYLIESDGPQRYLLVGGIRSTGLTAGLAIAEHVRALLVSAGLPLADRLDLPPTPRMPNLGEAFTRPYQDAQRIDGDPDYGRVVCFCERVTAGEIRDALDSTVPPASVEGLRRRTRVLNGRCQGFSCGAEIQQRWAEWSHDRPTAGAVQVQAQVSVRPRAGGTLRGAEAPVDLPVDLPVDRVRVAVIGSGPAGLTAAAALAATVDGEVRVLERETEPGGIPRHSDHSGFGLRDLRRVLTGPAYARRLAADAAAAGATIHTGTMVTGWAGECALEVTSPAGRRVVQADAVVLATGARERPRPARLIPGDRGAGVYTTGQLQSLVHLHHQRVGRRAVVIGAELVSWSAVMTLREAGCRTVLMTSQHRRPESYAAVTVAGRLALRVPVASRTRVVRINGKGRVESVDVVDLDTGARRTIGCDTVVTTGDWIPDNELARSGGLALDPATHGPVVDTALRTSAPGVFAVGNVLHPVDTADVAALDGRHVAGQVRAWLDGGRDLAPGVPIRVAAPLRWIAPQVLRRGDPAPARNRYLLWVDELVRSPRLTVHQDGRRLATRRLPWPAAPGRAFRVPAGLFAAVDPTGGPVDVGLA